VEPCGSDGDSGVGRNAYRRVSRKWSGRGREDGSGVKFVRPKKRGGRGNETVASVEDGVGDGVGGSVGGMATERRGSGDGLGEGARRWIAISAGRVWEFMVQCQKVRRRIGGSTGKLSESCSVEEHEVN
jgi:hypothetical protein